MRSAEMAPVSPPRMEARRATVSASAPLGHPAARHTSSSAGSARSPAIGLARSDRRPMKVVSAESKGKWAEWCAGIIVLQNCLRGLSRIRPPGTLRHDAHVQLQPSSAIANTIKWSPCISKQCRMCSRLPLKRLEITADDAHHNTVCRQRRRLSKQSADAYPAWRR